MQLQLSGFLNPPNVSIPFFMHNPYLIKYGCSAVLLNDLSVISRATLQPEKNNWRALTIDKAAWPQHQGAFINMSYFPTLLVYPQ